MCVGVWVAVAVAVAVVKTLQAAALLSGPHIKALKGMSAESIALVDDERTNFRSHAPSRFGVQAG